MAAGEGQDTRSRGILAFSQLGGALDQLRSSGRWMDLQEEGHCTRPRGREWGCCVAPGEGACKAAAAPQDNRLVKVPKGSLWVKKHRRNLSVTQKVVQGCGPESTRHRETEGLGRRETEGTEGQRD